MSMKVAADVAEWYDTVARNYKDEVLTDFVQKNPNFLGVAIAGSVSAHFDIVGAFWVDFARFGSDAAGGTAAGVFKDVLRALSAIPIAEVTAAGRPLISKLLLESRNIYWKAFDKQRCLPISIGKALEATGQRLIVRLEEVAKAMNRSVASFDDKGASINHARDALRGLKATFDEFEGNLAKSWEDIVLFAENIEGVIMVPLTRTITRSGEVLDKFHFIVVGKTPQGVRIFDRSGIYRSLEELSLHYQSMNVSEYYSISKHPLFFIKNWVLDPALANVLNAAGPLGAVVVQAAMRIAFNPTISVDVITQKFQEHVANEESLYPPPTQPPEMVSLMGTHTVEGPNIEKRDWLSSIAGEYYGDVLLWPILFDFNKGPDFTNQNKMYVGQRVKVPFIDDKTPEEIAEYRKRGLNWR